MQKKYFFGVNFIFLRKKGDFSDVFSAFYGQRSVMAAWATRSPWSIYFVTSGDYEAEQDFKTARVSFLLQLIRL